MCLAVEADLNVAFRWRRWVSLPLSGEGDFGVLLSFRPVLSLLRVLVPVWVEKRCPRQLSHIFTARTFHKLLLDIFVIACAIYLFSLSPFLFYAFLLSSFNFYSPTPFSRNAPVREEIASYSFHISHNNAHFITRWDKWGGIIVFTFTIILTCLSFHFLSTLEHTQGKRLSLMGIRLSLRVGVVMKFMLQLYTVTFKYDALLTLLIVFALCVNYIFVKLHYSHFKDFRLRSSTTMSSWIIVAW